MSSKSRRRRGRAEGSVYRRKNGLWCAAFTVGYDAQGKRRRRTVYGPTKGAVLEKLAKLQGDSAAGRLVEPNRLTVAQYLQRWLEDAARPKIRLSTYKQYEGIIRVHINPH